jgi:hypothetical protein
MTRTAKGAGHSGVLGLRSEIVIKRDKFFRNVF